MEIIFAEDGCWLRTQGPRVQKSVRWSRSRLNHNYLSSGRVAPAAAPTACVLQFHLLGFHRNHHLAHLAPFAIVELLLLKSQVIWTVSKVGKEAVGWGRAMSRSADLDKLLLLVPSSSSWPFRPGVMQSLVLEIDRSGKLLPGIQVVEARWSSVKQFRIKWMTRQSV